jgi:uncharacterized membrane protein YsdA (DUF1294 family)
LGSNLLPLLLLWLASVYGVASVLCFVVYAVDKAAATRGERRIPERTLLLLGLACGWPGGLLAQHWLRHKIRKTAFQVAFWVTVAVNLAAVGWFCTRY